MLYLFIHLSDVCTYKLYVHCMLYIFIHLSDVCGTLHVVSFYILRDVCTIGTLHLPYTFE